MIAALGVVVGRAAGYGNAGEIQPAAHGGGQELVEASPTRSAELRAILDAYVEFVRRENPIWATLQGDLRFNDRLPDASPAGVARRDQFIRDLLARAAAIDETRLSEADRLDRALLMRQLRLGVEWSAFYPEQMPMTSRAGPQFELPELPDRVPLATVEQRAAYVARLEAIPALLDQHMQQMRFGINAGRVPPRIVMQGTAEQCRSLALPEHASDPSLSPFFAPFRDSPEDPLAARAAEAIRAGIVPAFERLASFLEREYLPACRETIAARDSRDGLAMYELSLRQHTTTDLSAEEIHAIGLDEVARIRSEMLEVIRRTDWYAQRPARAGAQASADAAGRSGGGPGADGAGGAPPENADPDDDALFDAFVAFLRSDPRFYHETPEDLLREYRDICKRVDGELARLFRLLPRAPYGVRALPALGSEHAPNGYYYQGSLEAGLPAYFVVNVHALDQRPRYEMIALALHEAVPGHHLQIALAQEAQVDQDQHPFRREMQFTAFEEGWALYAERLGLEMGERPLREGGRGLYENPYDDFGRLTYEMWRACRLVVDTGIHAKGWSRERAVQFMRANTALSLANIESEINRYIGWPGQACGYKLGELKIRQWREEAEAALGDAFDIRAFHDMLLGEGEFPLDILGSRVRAWIGARADANARTGSPG